MNIKACIGDFRDVVELVVSVWEAGATTQHCAHLERIDWANRIFVPVAVGIEGDFIVGGVARAAALTVVHEAVCRRKYMLPAGSD